MNETERDMLMRHDEQLKAVPELAEDIRDLSDAVNSLTTIIKVQNAKRIGAMVMLSSLGAVMSCVGTWLVMVYTNHTK